MIRSVFDADPPSLARRFLVDTKRLNPEGQPLAANYSPNIRSEPVSVKSSPSASREIIDSYLRDYVPHSAEESFVDFMHQQSSGYWLLTAGPGMGKTAIMAGLVRRYSSPEVADAVKCAAVFFREAHGAEQKKSFYRFLRNWLRSNFDLSPVLDEISLVDDDTFFRESIEFLSSSGQVSQKRPLIVIADGLDEIEPAKFYQDPWRNPLEMPACLPNGVYVAHSARLIGEDKPEPHAANLPKPPNDLNIDLHHFQDHKEIVLRFVRITCEQEDSCFVPFRDRKLRPDNWRDDDAGFFRFLCDETEYNFMILKCILNERGEWREDWILRLTPDLEEYFQQHFRRMASNERYGADGRAMYGLALLPRISRSNLRRLASRPEDEDSKVSQILDGWLAQGLILSESDGEHHWLHAYHSRYREFLRGRLQREDRAEFINVFLRKLADPKLTGELYF